MSIIKYRAFTKIVELGSYAAAAKLLGYSQPGIHHMITSLEQELGHSILENDGKKIIPTPFGESILPHAYQIAKSADYISDTAAFMPDNTNTISIGSYNSMLISLVPDILNNFCTRNPDCTFRIRELTYNKCLQAIANHELDFCFMSDACPGGYQFIPLLKDPALLIMQKSHYLSKYDRVPIHALNGCDVLMYEPESDDIVATVMQTERFSPNARFCINTDTPSLELIRMCGGVGLLSSLELAKIPNELTYRLLDGNIHRNLGIVCKPVEQLSPLLCEFIQVAQDTAKSFCTKNGLKSL